MATRTAAGFFSPTSSSSELFNRFGNLMEQCAVFQYPVAESRHSPLTVKLRCVFAAYIHRTGINFLGGTRSSFGCHSSVHKTIVETRGSSASRSHEHSTRYRRHPQPNGGDDPRPLEACARAGHRDDGARVSRRGRTQRRDIRRKHLCRLAVLHRWYFPHFVGVARSRDARLCLGTTDRTARNRARPDPDLSAAGRGPDADDGIDRVLYP